jgi:hypothetical protein
MLRARVAMLVGALMLASCLGAGAQDRGRFYDGVRDGGHGGHYDRGHDHGRYERGRRYDDRDQDHGIGPGKGALIGGGGGAVLGALLGGGLKGAIVGVAAGAGIGAIVGKAHQDNQDDRYRR